MPTLKEIKGRIGSVRNTLKITSAMKLVSSAKLRKAQEATEAMRAYETALMEMLSLVSSGNSGVSPDEELRGEKKAPRAIIAISSNSSLCGGFNAGAIAMARNVRKEGDVVFSIGRKMADVMRRDGFPSPKDLSALAEKPSYAPCADLVEELIEDFADGKISGVRIVHMHFVSTVKQVPVAEDLFLSPHAGAPDDIPDESAPAIFEPSARKLREMLLSKALRLKLYSALLDSVAAEHAARTIAMQTATDNGEKLLDELTLEYNKGRQQKITNEILDLAGGALQ